MIRATVLSLAALGLVLVGCSASNEGQNTASTTNAGAPASNNAATASTAGEDANATSANSADANSGATEKEAKGDEKGAAYAGLNLKQRMPMVPFKLTTTKGETVTNDTFRGKVVLLDFWATWCAPCKEASPTMEKLHRTYEKDGLVVVGVNAGEEEDKETAAATYQKEHGYTYMFTKNNDKIARDILLENFPCFIFLDREGNVRKVDRGFALAKTPAEFEAAIKVLLAEKV